MDDIFVDSTVYACSKCSTPNKPMTTRLVIWSRERGYLCSVCAGSFERVPERPTRLKVQL